jgi:putative heme-binding domain-containing protein
MLQLLDPKLVKSSPVASRALTDALQKTYGTPTYIQLVGKNNLKSESPKLLKIAVDKSGSDIATDALELAIQLEGDKNAANMLKAQDSATMTKLIPTLGRAGSKIAMNTLQNIMQSKSSGNAIRTLAAENIGKSWDGQARVVELLQTKQVPENLVSFAVEGMKDGERKNMYEKAKTFLPGAQKQASENKNITVNEILAVKPNGKNGQRVFKQNCAVCHMVKNEGKDFGPKLTEIGDKLPKEALFEAITIPSKSIGFGYETTELTMKNGDIMTGIVSNKTASEIELKVPGGTKQKFMRTNVKSMKTTGESMMPVLHESISKQEFADLLEYLSALKKK